MRQRTDLLDAGIERLGEFVDAMRERIEAGRAGALRDVVDARAERLHVAGKRGDALGRRDTGGELAQLVDRGFEIAQRFGIGRADREAVHLARSSDIRSSNPARLSAGVIALSALMHLGKTALDASQRGRVGAAAITVIDPLSERLHVALQAFERAARQRLMDRARDFGEVGAQLRDRILDAGRAPQRLDLCGDVVKLLFEAGEIRVGRGACAPARGDAGAAVRVSSARCRAAISAIA